MTNPIPKRYRALGAALVSIALQAWALNAAPSCIAELTYASAQENALVVMGAWNAGGVGPVRVGGAVVADFLLIWAYWSGLKNLVQWASVPNGTSPTHWAKALLPWVRLAVALAAILDIIENGLLLVFLAGAPIPWIFLFAVATGKLLLLGIVVWYIIAGFRLWKNWEPARQVIDYCGFSIFASIAAPGALFFGGQGAELFRILSDRGKPFEILCSLLAMGVFSLACWGSARIILDYNPNIFRGADGRSRTCWSVDWVPRFTAFVPLIIFLALSVRGTGISTLTGGIIGILLLVGLYTVYRRQWFSQVTSERWKSLDFYTALGSWIIGLGFLVRFGVSGPYSLVEIASIGPVAAWLFGFALSVPFFSFMVYLGRKLRFPVLALLLTYAFLINLLNLNDNHGVRFTKIKKDKRPTINEGFTKWLKKRAPDWEKAHPGEAYPVLFVAAEGGGIRAAAQVTTTMAALHENREDAKHLFAISGVSGGSLGAAVYSCLIREQEGKTELWAEKAKRIFTTDLLSPTVASLAGPELVQRFLPFPWPRMGGDPNFINEWQINRGRALDVSLETAYTKQPKPTLSPITQLLSAYPAPDEKDAPALFLNTTCVETGQAMVISTLLPDDDSKKRPPFETLSDVASDIDLELNVAACLSARFPLASPPGYLPQVREVPIQGAPAGTTRLMTVKRRYVDGGYFDNSGLTTVSGLVDTLRAGDDCQRPRWRPVVVAIRYDPNLLDDSLGKHRKELRAKHPIRTSGFDEVLGPVMAFFNGWGGPPGPIRNAFQNRPRVAYHEIVFGERDKPLILGWYLSEGAYKQLQDQLKKEETAKNLEQLKKELR